ncbi:MAG TPA: hypothetical protein VJH65_03455 [Candidatus Nanoarchaeia archaeon]|nr:hypothetical protein [Candidatus Nanoarchaeia archaeon]
MKFKFNFKRFSGVFLFWIGVLFVLNSLSGITGYAVVEGIGKTSSSFFGLGLILLGVVLFLSAGSLERRVEQIRSKLKLTLEGGRIGSYGELLKLAKSLDYEIKQGSKHYKVYKGKSVITEIPRHGSAKTGTYRRIAKDLYRNI